MATPASPTLHEDWCLRRELLQASPGPMRAAYRDAQLKILDYLLKRYAGDSEVARPARFPLRTDVVWKQRTLVVHRHLGLAAQGTRRRTEDAGARASRILARIAEKAPQEQAQTPGGGALGVGEFSGLIVDSLDGIPVTLKAIPGVFIGRDRQALLLSDFSKLESADQMELLGRWFKALLPRDGVAPLWHDGRSQMAWNCLSGCAHPEALCCVMTLWKEYLLIAVKDCWLDEMESFLRRPEHRERAADLLRAELANDRSIIRLRAMRLLPEFGSLDDVGLLSDLLNLPPQKDEAEGERDEILAALRRLSGEGRAGGQEHPE